MATKTAMLLALALFGLVAALPAASADPGAVDTSIPLCEDILDEDYCNGPEGTCRSVFSDAICDTFFDPTRLIF